MNFHAFWRAPGSSIRHGSSRARNPENIRIADLLVDILFAANGETYESLQPYFVTTTVEAVPIVTVNIEGPLRTKTTLECGFNRPPPKRRKLSSSTA